jgi:hypothetical protein
VISLFQVLPNSLFIIVLPCDAMYRVTIRPGLETLSRPVRSFVPVWRLYPGRFVVLSRFGDFVPAGS